MLFRSPSGKQKFDLKVRIPGWVQGDVVPSDLYTYIDGKELSYSVNVNGVPVKGEVVDGYFTINREWRKGDKVNVNFEMQPRMVKAHDKVEADRGRVSIERGPLVYCAEWPDNQVSVLSFMVNKNPEFVVEQKPELLNGINTIRTTVQSLGYTAEGKLVTQDAELTMIPYYAWAHRGQGEMIVWLPSQVNAVRPMNNIDTSKTEGVGTNEFFGGSN